MKVFLALVIIIAAASAQYAPADYNVPIPYSFNYVAEGEEGGQSSHQESGDGSGRVQGSYSLNNLEGHSRIVEYVADEGGFRAVVRTNEPGTANQNPADVVVESSAEGGPVQPAARPAVRTFGRPVAARQPGVRYVLVPVQA